MKKRNHINQVRKDQNIFFCLKAGISGGPEINIGKIIFSSSKIPASQFQF
jgi:hypothetical protein